MSKLSWVERCDHCLSRPALLELRATCFSLPSAKRSVLLTLTLITILSFTLFTFHVIHSHFTLQGGPKKLAHFVLYALTSSNIDRFSNLFQYQNHENMYNNTVTKDPTTPRVLLHCVVKCQCFKATTENKTTSVTTHFDSASIADTFNVWRKNCGMRQLL